MMDLKKILVLQNSDVHVRNAFRQALDKSPPTTAASDTKDFEAFDQLLEELTQEAFELGQQNGE